jgi:hypothetical protein
MLLSTCWDRRGRRSSCWIGWRSGTRANRDQYWVVMFDPENYVRFVSQAAIASLWPSRKLSSSTPLSRQ